MVQNNRKRFMAGLLSLSLGLGLYGACHSSVQAQGGTQAVSYEPFVGLRRAHFKTDAGEITVNVPDDMSAGDLVSGTTVILANGANDAERSANADRLKHYSVSLADVSSPIAGHTTPFQWHIPPGFTSGSTTITLKDPNGADVGSAGPVAVMAMAPVVDRSSMPHGFILPHNAEANSQVQVYGMFDGNMGTSELKVGGAEAMKLAESPRKLVAQMPPDCPAETTLSVSKNGQTFTQHLHVCGAEGVVIMPGARARRHSNPMLDSSFPLYEPHPTIDSGHHVEGPNSSSSSGH
jgi:hypothetical protein